LNPTSSALNISAVDIDVANVISVMFFQLPPSSSQMISQKTFSTFLIVFNWRLTADIIPYPS
jgi:hypothetical protein